MTIDTKEFIELVLLDEKYRSEGKNFFQFEREKYHKYYHFLSLIFNQIYWEKAEDYLRLVNLFCNNKMTADEFQTEVFTLQASNKAKYNQLKEQLKYEVQSGKLTITEIEINPQSKRFTKIIDEHLFNLLDLYDPNVTLEEDLAHPDSLYIAMSGASLKSIIEKHIKPKLENYCAGKRQR